MALPSGILALTEELQCAGSCSRQLAVGTDCSMSPPAQQLQGSLTPGMSMHALCAAPHSRLGLQVRLLGAGVPWPLLCPFPQDDVQLETDLVKLVSGVAFCLLPSASGPWSLACIKLHKSQGCCQFPLVRKGQMEARVTTFMFLSGSGCALHSGREACAVPRWALAADVPVWAARALGLVL